MKNTTNRGPGWLMNALKWLGLQSTVYGVGQTPYLTRFFLTPMTPWGQLRFHLFHRPDEDPDPHDHPWDFWTFPLTSYLEERMEGTGHVMSLHVVRAFRIHARKAEHAHKVIGRVTIWGNVDTTKRLYSIVWASGIRRPWGFWTQSNSPDDPLPERHNWVDWRTYLNVHGAHERRVRYWLAWPYTAPVAVGVLVGWLV